MEKFGILVRLEAKPGKEEELSAFLASALPLAQAEPATIKWYALKIGTSTFGIFDSFSTIDGRNDHLNGSVAAALLSKADDLLVSPPLIELVDLISVK